MPPLSRIVPSWPNLSLTGVIDILVVAFVVYQALMVIRGTRAGHILIGILTMVTIYAIALWAGLEALRSLLSFIVPYLGLAIIVLFQSEIRRTLARIGRKNWFGLRTGFRAPESASENADAAKLLIERVMEKLSPQARLVITLLEIEDRSVKEIAQITGWSVPLVKVRAFRARAEMRKIIAKIAKDKYL